MTIGLTDKIVPLGDFPIVEDLYVEGGFRSVADTTARDAIPVSLRKEGMLVWCRAEASMWQLIASSWVPFSGGGGFTAGGDLSGTSTSQRVVGIQGKAFYPPGTPGTLGQVAGIGFGPGVSFSNPTGIVYDGTYLWVSCSSSSIVYQVDLADWTDPKATVDTALVAFGTTSVYGLRFSYPYVACAVGSGNVVLIDVGPGPNQNTIVGWGSTGTALGGSVVALDYDGQIWINDGASGVACFSLGDLLTVFPSPAAPTATVDLGADALDIVLDDTLYEIWAVTGGTDLFQINTISRVVTSQTVAGTAQVSLCSGLGSLWAAQGTDPSFNVLKYAPTAFPSDPPAVINIPEAGVVGLRKMGVDSTGLYIGDTGRQAIYRVVSDVYADFVVNADSDSIDALLVIGGMSGIYWAAVGTGGGPSNGYRTMDLASTLHSDLSPTAMGWFDGFTADGDLSGTALSQTVIGLQNRSIFNVGVDGDVLSTSVATPAPFVDPVGITWDGTYLWVGSGSSSYVHKINPADWTRPVLSIDLTPYSIPNATFLRTWDNYILVGGGTAYSGNGTFIVIDWTTNTVVGWGDCGTGDGAETVVGDLYGQVWINGGTTLGAWYFSLSALLAAFPSSASGTQVPISGLGATAVQAVCHGSDGDIWAGSGGGDGAYLTRINPGGHTVVATHHDGLYDGIVQLASYGGYVWATLGSSNKVLKYDIGSFPDAPTELTLTTTGVNPYLWDISVQGSYIFFPDDGDYSSVYYVNAFTDEQAGTLTGVVDDWCNNIVYTGTDFWVTIGGAEIGIIEITTGPYAFQTLKTGFTGGTALKWVAPAFSAGGDLSGTSTSQTVVGLQGNAVAAAAPDDGDVLTWNDTASQWEPAAGGGGSFTAGGDLDGTSSNQTVVGLQTRALASTAPSDGQVIKWNDSGNQWEPGAVVATSPATADGLARRTVERSYPADLSNTGGSFVIAGNTSVYDDKPSILAPNTASWLSDLVGLDYSRNFYYHGNQRTYIFGLGAAGQLIAVDPYRGTFYGPYPVSPPGGTWNYVTSSTWIGDTNYAPTYSGITQLYMTDTVNQVRRYAFQDVAGANWGYLDALTLAGLPGKPYFDGKYMWVVGGNTLYKCITPNGTAGNSGIITIGTLEAGTTTGAVIFDGSRIVVLCTNTTAVQFYARSVGAGGSPSSSATLPASCTHVAFDGRNLWFTKETAISGSYGGVYRMDPSGTVTSYTLPTGLPIDIVFDGAYIWVAANALSGANDATLVALDPDTGDIVNVLIKYYDRYTVKALRVFPGHGCNTVAVVTGLSTGDGRQIRLYSNAQEINARYIRATAIIPTFMDQGRSSASGPYEPTSCVVVDTAGASGTINVWMPPYPLSGFEFTVIDATGGANTHNIVVNTPDTGADRIPIRSGATYTYTINTNWGWVKFKYVYSRYSNSWLILGSA